MTKKTKRFLNRLLFAFIIFYILIVRIGQVMNGTAMTTESILKLVIPCGLAIIGLVVVNFVLKVKDDEKNSSNKKG